MTDYIDIVFDGPPGPEAGRFVEVESSDGRGMRFGEWVQRSDGYWALRIRPDDVEVLADQPANELVRDSDQFGVGA